MAEAVFPVVVTGGGQRLGLALCRHLLDSGMAVVTTYRTERPALDDLRSRGAVCLQADLAQPAGIVALVGELEKRYAGLRAIVHNAGDWVPEDPGSDPLTVFERNVALHARAPYLMNLALGPLLESLPDGEVADIIHVTDYVAERGSGSHVAYAASKAALASMTQSFAVQLAPRVKVNSIAPALLLFREQDDADYRRNAASRSLLPPAPGEREYLNAVDFILASRYLTGRTIHLDGGRPLV